MAKGGPGGSTFLRDAARYAGAADDEAFVEELAYVMVTLHRSGA